MESGIRVEHLSKSLEVFRLEDIHFTMPQGYVLGLIGRNGAGKTTLLNTLMGLYTPEEGHIYIGDYDRVTEAIKAKEQLAFVTDESFYPTSMTPAGIGWLFRSVYKGFQEAQYKKLCKRFGLPMHRTLRKMSKGMVIKLELALAFSRDASVYIFDEPSAGLDPVFRKELVDLIFDLIQDGKKTVIFSTHLTDELDRIADYILLLEQGKQVLFEQKEDLISRYRLLRGSEEMFERFGQRIIGKRLTEHCCEALICLDSLSADEIAHTLEAASTSTESTGNRYCEKPQLMNPTVEDIMYYFIKGKEGSQ